jgi:hypothetical protein
MVMVEEIEAVIGRPIAECFDLVAGTSIGGCGALIISQFPAHGEAVRKARQAFYKCAALRASQHGPRRLSRLVACSLKPAAADSLPPCALQSAGAVLCAQATGLAAAPRPPLPR